MIPREIDELMWTVAEGGDPHAISEFGDRYPNMREELLKRLKTVQALKAGKRSVKAGAVPTFRTTQTKPVNWRPIWATFAVTILAISAFGVWRINAAPTPVVNVPTINVEAPKLPESNIEVDRGLPSPHSMNGERRTEPPINPPIVEPPTSVGLPIRTSLQVESASLHTAITMIADAGKLSVTIAPGTPDPVIRVDFQDMTPMDMLKELGQQYAFDTLLDGERAIIIIPKKDEDDDQMTNETR